MNNINDLEKCETIPSYEQYLLDRSSFFNRIWLNVWTNKAANDVTKKGKRAFLKEKGYEVEGVERKLIKGIRATEQNK